MRFDWVRIQAEWVRGGRAAAPDGNADRPCPMFGAGPGL